MKYDIAIIGGGPAGYTAAERAAANGLQTVLFEKKAIGGVCLNEGCPYQNSTLFRQVVGQYERRVQVWHLCARWFVIRYEKDYRP